VQHLKELLKPVTYSEVVLVEDMSKDTLFTKVNMWFVDAFKSAESVIQYSDKESGVIKGKYVGNTGTKLILTYNITSTITVEVRDGRYRILFDNPFIRAYDGHRLAGEGPVTTQEFADKVMDDWKNLSESLKTSINSEVLDW